MADAVNYTLGQWEALTVFTSDGAVPIDNNVSEREMKRVVLNRNYVQFRIMLSAAVKSAIVSLFVGRSGLTALMN
jgi:transposase